MTSARSPTVAATVALLGLLAVLTPGRRAATDDLLPDVTCSWDEATRRGPVRGGRVRLRLRARLLVAAEGLPGPRRVALEVHGSDDDVLDASDPLLLRRRVKLKPDRTRRISVRERLSLDPPVRYLFARIDAEDEVAERDESDNVVVHGPLLTGREYLPIATGDTWRFAGRRFEPDDYVEEYVNAVTVVGPHYVGGGETAQAVRSSYGSSGEGEEVTYYQHTPEGLLDWGTDVEDDLVPSKVFPYCLFPLPFVQRYRYSALRARNVRVPDMEGDGRPEWMTLTRRVRFRGLEDVEIDGETFAECARVRISTRVTLYLSRLRRAGTVKITENRWLAPEIGPVQTFVDFVPRSVGYRTEERMTACAVGSTGHGVLRDLSLGDPPLDTSDLLSLEPALATDGERVLLVTGCTSPAGTEDGVFGRVVTARAGYGPWFRIHDAVPTGIDSVRPSVCHGGGRFLVAFVAQGRPPQARTVAFDGDDPVLGAAHDLPASRCVAATASGAGFRLLRSQAADWPAEAQVRLAELDADGAFVDEQVLADGGVRHEGIAISDDGSATLCVWCSANGLAYVRVGPSGDVLDPYVRLLDPDADSASRPAAIPSPAGGWIVAWDHSDSGRPTRVRVAHVRADGTSSPSQGRTLGDLTWADSRAALAFDGRDVVVLAEIYGGSPSNVIRAVRLSGTAEPLSEPDGTLGVLLSEEDSPWRAAAAGAARVLGRVVVAWRRYDVWTPGSTSLGGALLFPRRE